MGERVDEIEKVLNKEIDVLQACLVHNSLIWILIKPNWFNQQLE